MLLLWIYAYIISYVDGYSVDWHDLLAVDEDIPIVNNVEYHNENKNKMNIRSHNYYVDNDEYFEMTLLQAMICIFCGFMIGIAIGSILTNCLYCVTTAYRNSFKH